MIFLTSHFLAHFVKDLLHHEVIKMVAIKTNHSSVLQNYSQVITADNTLIKNTEYQVAHSFWQNSLGGAFQGPHYE